MKNLFFYILLVLLLITIASFVLGYFKVGFAVGSVLVVLVMSIGTYYSMKNQDYVHKSWHDDYVDRRKK